MPNNNVLPAEEGKPAEPKTSWVNVFSVLLGLLTVLSTHMALLGYGVALAIESLFGLPRTTVFSSAFELIELANVSFLHLIVSWQKQGWSQLFSALGNVFITVLIPSFLVVMLMLLLLFWVRTLQRKGRLKGIWRYGNTPPEAIPVKHKLYAITGVTSAGVFVFVPAMLALSVLLIILCTKLLAFIPIASMQAGKSYLTAYVVNPKQCVTAKTRAERLAPSSSTEEAAVECVRVVRGNEVVGHGRVVLSTSSAIVLWQSHTGIVRRIPLADAMVELAPEPGDPNFKP
jgi:hypothetical protein